MVLSKGYELMREQHIDELNTRAELFRHRKTGAEILSLINDDENKVFGIAFMTPPGDSTGVPHILEHSVLCGSRKYPVKEPFVELLKGSLQTFLNAMTFPDKTCYPVASQNVKDLYNLIDVYLDAVFFPHLTPLIFRQEGWHLELENQDKSFKYKGVVFSEMKGAYSSPDTLLAEYSQQSLFPDSPYRFDSGGDPKEISELTYAQFKAFHERYYHPSNARIFFYGDDPPERRLEILGEYLDEFDRQEIDSSIPLQPPLDRPRQQRRPFIVAEGEGEKAKGMITLNWLLHDTTAPEMKMAGHILEYILLGMPGSPLRKALIDSNYGEDIAGVGLASDLRQMYFSTGLKGIEPANAPKIETLILETLERLVSDGIDPGTVEAAVNTIEFNLRENNTGHFPRGLSLMLRSLKMWLYEEDPLALVAFERPLNEIKSLLSSNPRFFEGMIEKCFLRNPHRTTLILEPDPRLSAREEEAERERLSKLRSSMDPREIQDVVRLSEELRKMQETPDPPEALARIPRLRLEDLDKRTKEIPISLLRQGGTTILYHDIFTNGILYLDLGFNLHTLPQEYLPYVPLFGRALLEMGTTEEDYVALTQRISRKTGGIRPVLFNSATREGPRGALWLFLRGKSMEGQTRDLLDILRDVLLKVKLDNPDRFRQMVLEEKARYEHVVIPSGHHFLSLRLRSHFNEADWAAEQMKGISYIFFLRSLIKEIDGNWPGVHERLEELRQRIINSNAMVFNVTADKKAWSRWSRMSGEFIDQIPRFEGHLARWEPSCPPPFEGLTIPSKVNFVGKGANLYDLGYEFHGSALVISRFLRNAWLWERIRLQGGAYGAYCQFDRLSGGLNFLSYRDPNLLRTLETFDSAASFLKETELSNDELIKGIIGTIGDIDQHLLPDAKGYVSMARHLSGETEAERQQMREEVLSTSPRDFKEFAQILEAVAERGLVKVLGSREAIQGALSSQPEGWLQVLDVL
ncbi:MAG: insulinase family protein [Deltaproteobacteria bacterium]|nr:insulinase family protein [Deltaproteobacteria bacterium]